MATPIIGGQHAAVPSKAIPRAHGLRSGGGSDENRDTVRTIHRSFRETTWCLAVPAESGACRIAYLRLVKAQTPPHVPIPSRLQCFVEPTDAVEQGSVNEHGRGAE